VLSKSAVKRSKTQEVEKTHVSMQTSGLIAGEFGNQCGKNRRTGNIGNVRGRRKKVGKGGDVDNQNEKTNVRWRFSEDVHFIRGKRSKGSKVGTTSRGEGKWEGQ